MGQVLYEMYRKVLFFSIYWMNINSYYVHCWESIWNNTYTKKPLHRAIINPFCDLSKLGWYWNKLKYSKEMNVYTYEPFWIITWHFSMHYWFAKSSKYIYKQHLRRFPYIGCKLCTHRCVYVGTINTSFTKEQVSLSELAYWATKG